MGLRPGLGTGTIPGVAEPSSERTRVRRHPDRASYEMEDVLQILDEGLICHLGFVVDDQPYVVPTMYARSGEQLFIHGSPLSRMLSTAADGVPLCLTVTMLDGLVLARSVFNHSMNFRSVMVLGRATEVLDEAAKSAAFKALVDHVIPGRWQDARHPTPKELATTKVLSLPLAEASCKIRRGATVEPSRDRRLPVWAGVVPMSMVAGAAVPEVDLPPGLELPGYLNPFRRGGVDQADVEPPDHAFQSEA